MEGQAQVKERYQAALDRLVARLEEDYYVLAAVLYGSVARGEPWERSDIDLIIVLRDGQERDNRELWMVEDEINVMAWVVSRNRFKRALEGALQGSMGHSIRSQHRLLFSKDESIAEWVRESDQVGAHDQAYQLLSRAVELSWMMDKAEKWFYAKRDLNYSFLWILMAVNALAKIEVVLNGHAPGREALDQALKFNPEFFQKYYIDLINGPKTEDSVHSALEAVDGYLAAHMQPIFRLLLDFLAQAEGPVTASEMHSHFSKKLERTELSGVCDWLVRKGVIQKLSSPVRLTRKSTVTLEEPAFYYDDGNDADILSDWE